MAVVAVTPSHDMATPGCSNACLFGSGFLDNLLANTTAEDLKHCVSIQIFSL